MIDLPNTTWLAPSARAPVTVAEATVIQNLSRYLGRRGSQGGAGDHRECLRADELSAKGHLLRGDHQPVAARSERHGGEPFDLSDDPASTPTSARRGA